MISGERLSRYNTVWHRLCPRMLMLINALKIVCAAAHALSCGCRYVVSPCRVTP